MTNRERAFNAQRFLWGAHLLLLLVTIGTIGIFAGCSPSGPKRYDVSGSVSVDGVPAEGMLVQMIRMSPGEGNDQYPSTISNVDGSFQFGGRSTVPGLIEGEYAVTFAWLEGKDLETRDKFKGKLADAKASPYRLTIPSESTKNLVFDLTMPK
jgi:hypothetical protein